MIVFGLVYKSSFIDSDCKVIILFEKAQMEESQRYSAWSSWFSCWGENIFLPLKRARQKHFENHASHWIFIVFRPPCELWRELRVRIPVDQKSLKYIIQPDRHRHPHTLKVTYITFPPLSEAVNTLQRIILKMSK